MPDLIPASPFPLGRIVATSGVIAEIPTRALSACILRHSICDWGEVDAEETAANNNALTFGGRLLSTYHVMGKDNNKHKVYVITDGLTPKGDDQKAWSTTVLFPEEY